MIPLVVKDLTENFRAWVLLLTGAMLITILAVIQRDSKMGLDFTSGFTKSLILASSLIFTQTIVASERKQGPFILLKTLPISSLEIVGAKFLSVLILMLPLLIVAQLTEGLLVGSVEWMRIITQSAFIVFFSALLLCLSVAFRNPAAAFVPFYLVLGMILLSDSNLLGEIWRLLTGSSGVIGVYLIIGTALLFVITVNIFRRKELNL
jgi:hypothetical protein